MSGVIGRFAPSPSGRMHLGNVFSFLAAWLLSRSQGGSVVLRIEDLDPVRTSREYASLCMDDLQWLGLAWDGAPVFQSERTDAYLEAFEKLRKDGFVYPCYCSRSDWHAAAAPHAGDHIVYPGTCRHLTAEQRAQRESLRKPAWRFDVGEGTVCIDDLFQGRHAYSMQEDCGDCIIRRADDVFAYQLAVVVDDAYQSVTQVCRGFDLLDSAATQRRIQDALCLPWVEYAHVPVLRASDGRRLAKRDADMDMGVLRERFREPEYLYGYLCRLVGLRKDDSPVGLDELVESFEVSWFDASDIVIDL